MTKGDQRIRDLDRYINALKDKNNFDLAWCWCGTGWEPMLEVYEEADRHVLTWGTPDNIINNVRESLGSWGLVDVDG